MKYLVVFGVVIVAVLADELYTQEQIAQLKAINKECEESSHVDHEKVTQMKKRIFDDGDQHLKDYVFCVFKKLHWMDDDGHVEKDTIKKFLIKSTIATQAAEQCMDKHGTTGPDTAYTMYKCYMEHLPADYKYPL